MYLFCHDDPDAGPHFTPMSYEKLGADLLTRFDLLAVEERQGDSYTPIPITATARSERFKLKNEDDVICNYSVFMKVEKGEAGSFPCTRLMLMYCFFPGLNAATRNWDCRILENAFKKLRPGEMSDEDTYTAMVGAYSSRVLRKFSIETTEEFKERRMTKLPRPLRPDVPQAKHAHEKPGPPITEEDADRLKAGKKVHTAGPGAGKGAGPAKSPKDVVSPEAPKGTTTPGKSPKRIVSPGVIEAMSQGCVGTPGAKGKEPDISFVVIKIWNSSSEVQFNALHLSLFPVDMMKQLKLDSLDELTDEERCARHVAFFSTSERTTFSVLVKVVTGETADCNSYLKSVI